MVAKPTAFAVSDPDAAEKYTQLNRSTFVERSTARIAMCRNSSMSCHLNQAALDLERLLNEVVPARKRRIEPQLPDTACINELRQSGLLYHNVHTVPLLP
jgi:hypothetical protein